MANTLTLTDDKYSANSADSRKRIYATLSVDNYVTGGIPIDVSSYFPTKFDGGRVLGCSLVTTIAKAGIAHTGMFRANNASTTAAAPPLLQFFNNSTGAGAALWVDNSTTDLTGTSVLVELIGR